ncbi:MAG: hypothetical protein ABIE07_03510 [Candidatus Zixiibacteriota bacterium]
MILIRSKLIITLLLIFALGVYSGCSSVATQKAFYEPIEAELRQGNFSSAVAQIEKAKTDGKYKKKDRFLYFLDAGLAYHYNLQFDSSNLRLTEAEDAADELYTRSISRAVGSMILNDNILEYAGEDYEILYSNLIKALNYGTLDFFDDAFVEIRRANEKLNLLEQKYRDEADMLNAQNKDESSRVDINYEAKAARFNNSAFARYLSMHMYAADGKYDDAELDYDLMRRAFIEQPHIYDFDMPDVIYASDSQAVLSIVGLIGFAPVKEAMNLRLRTDKELKLVQVLYDDPNKPNSEYGHIPMDVKEDYYFKFSIPQIVTQPTYIKSIRVFADDAYLGDLRLIEDIGKTAIETFEAKKSLIYLKTLARAIAKGLKTHNMKKKSDEGGGGWLKKLVIDAVSDFTENADLRCSRLLPGYILVGDFELPPGQHNLKIQLIDTSGIIIKENFIDDFQLGKTKFNLLEVIHLN